MAGTIVQYKIVKMSEGNTATATFDNDFTPGNALVIALLWSNYIQNSPSTLSTITDNKSHTFTKRFGGHRDPVSGDYTDDLYAEIHDCLNAADASPGTHITFTFTPVTANGYNGCHIAIMEVSGLSAFSTVGTQTGGGYNSVSVGSATGTLASAPQWAVAAMGSWASNISQPTGWSTLSTEGTDDGCPDGGIVYKRTETQSALSPTWTYDTSQYGAAAALATYTEIVSGTSLRMRFDMDPSTFTSADTSVEGYVWVDSYPDETLGIFFDGLAGDATAGKLYIPDTDPRWPAGLTAGKQLVGVFYNATDGSKLMTGVVEAA